MAVFWFLDRENKGIFLESFSEGVEEGGSKNWAGKLSAFSNI